MAAKCSKFVQRTWRAAWLAVLVGWATGIASYADEVPVPPPVRGPASAPVGWLADLPRPEPFIRQLPVNTGPAVPARPAPQAPAGNPTAAAYKGVYYDNDFSYLDDQEPRWLSDTMKRLQVGKSTVVDVGGEYRLRHHDENNLRGSDLSGRDDNFLLERTRLFVNVDTGDFLRFYGEAIDATSHWENFAPRLIEENRFDALNLFADALVMHTGDGEVWIRGGRQELLYGNQRLISPLDWANTRRTFDGLKMFYRSDALNIDAFWTRPVPFSQHVNHDHNFDHPNLQQEFIGLYTTYTGRPGRTYEMYYLRLADYAAADFDVNLFGGRWYATANGWLAELEGGYQFGDVGPRDQSAGFTVVGVGREIQSASWKPTLWAYYDWASGDDNPNDNIAGTFNQLFPLGHKYMGYADLVARQNIHDVNFLLTAKPGTKLNLLMWWHIFYLDSARDALYNANGTPIRIDPTGASGREVGQELDVTLQYALSPRADLLLGYSHFYAGDFVRATNPQAVTGDVDFVYTQFNWRF